MMTFQLPIKAPSLQHTGVPGEEALGNQEGPTKANLLISDLFSRLSNEIC
jgi:hypothetical protein